MRRTVKAERMLPASCDRVTAVLASGPARQTSTVVLSLGGGASVGHEVQVTLTAPVLSSDGACWALAWAPDRHRRLLPAFDGSLLVEPDGSESWLRLTGGYRPPLGPLGAVFDAVVGRRIAKRSVERFVDGLVAHIGAELLRRADLSPYHPPSAPPDLNPRRHLA